ncbi:MAG: pyridoxal phosphate-dependent aminotransferase family protein [Chloroflexi bacterium]|nr:pyridoxal phosphate-dependent aminotransferase family protein [Chloroflexota bacterium]
MNYVMESPPGPSTLINGRWRDYFSGCSYLGLQNHPALIQAATEALQRYGLAAATSRGGYGEHPVYHAVEEAAARFFAAPRAIYYVSGYLGATILAQGLRRDYDHIFADDASHFSIRDGAATAGAPVSYFRHLDAAYLAAALRAKLRPAERPLIFSDGVFPISGEIAPAADYLAILADYEGAILCLDDAHATGVLGEGGRGTLAHWHGENAAIIGQTPVYTAHTFSKAMGAGGGVIAGSAALIEQLERDSTTPAAHSPAAFPVAAAAARSLALVAAEPALRQRLRVNVAHARAGLSGLGWQLPDTPVPIICLTARPGMDLARLQAELFARDICVAHATRYSSTPAGGALRVAIFATHAREQIDRLVAELGRLL